MMAGALATVAELEAANTSERVRDAQQFLTRQGRFRGGRAPYGYRVVPNPDGAGYVLAVNDATAPVLREAVSRVIAGESVNSVALDFCEREIPAPHGKFGYWNQTSLAAILRSRVMLGHAVLNGAVVIGDDGLPLTRAEPLVSAVDWSALQTALDARSLKKTRTRTPTMLLNIAFCAECGAPLYRRPHRQARSKVIRLYYECRNAQGLPAREQRCRARIIPMAELDAAADELVMQYAWVDVLKCGLRMHAQRSADGRVSARIESKSAEHTVAMLGGFESADAMVDCYVTQPVKARLDELGLPWPSPGA